MEKTNETISAARRNVDRAKNNARNSVIYRYFKEEDIAQLTDEEFEILQTKTKMTIASAPIRASFHDFSESSDASGLKGDETTLNIFKRAMAAHSMYFPCFENYSRVFSFCRSLGVANLYDIGCGNQLQAFLLMEAPEMNYTGIDGDIFCHYPDNFMADPDYINGLFEEFTGSGRIRYVKERYPCDLAVAENNIALFLYCFFGIDSDGKKWKNAAAALSRDFERVLFNLPFMEYNLTGMDARDIIYNEVEVWTNPFEKYYDMWKNAMPDFEFYRIGEPNFVFGTKFPEDREKLEKRYTLADNKAMTGAIDIPWHQELRK